jgi:hypothetical protein
MLTFFAALRQKCANSSSLKSSVSAIIHDAEAVGTDLQRSNIANMKKITIVCQSLEYIVSMLTFFAALHHKCANTSSLKLFVSARIDDAETVGTDLQQANMANIEKNNNCVNPLNIQ